MLGRNDLKLSVISFKTVLRLLRPKQWTKNIFVFPALVFSKQLFQPTSVGLSLRAFFAFSFAASFVYVTNDIADRERDRAHPVKRFRPIASGEISLRSAFLLAGLMLAITAAFMAGLDWRFVACLVTYLLMNVAYSFYLKDVVLIDVFVIAIGFMLRVIGGAMVLDVASSSWLILTTMFLSLFLGVAKRRGELITLGLPSTSGESGFQSRKVLEQYTVEFAEEMTTICASGFVFSYALYTVSDRTVNMFGTENLVFTTPFVLYGVFRYLYLLHKKHLGENPTDVVLSDRPMLLNFVAYAIAMLTIIYLR